MNLFFLLIAMGASVWGAGVPETPKSVIENFYRAYLHHMAHDSKPAPDVPFSKSFRALIDRNAKVCKEKAEGDICGWSADGDPYLNAQDGDKDLTYERAVVDIREPVPGRIRVRIRNFPDSAPGTITQIEYLMIRENDRWVVDDMITDRVSDRKSIQDEINLYLHE